MEILVVMVIIVVLATLTISIYTWLETRKNEQATESIVRKIEMGLESYHSDHDRYPYGTEAPFNNHGVAVANGEEYSSNVVYMALQQLRNPKNVKMISLFVAAIFVLSCFAVTLQQGAFTSIASAAASESAIGVVNYQMLLAQSPDIAGVQDAMKQEVAAQQKNFDEKSKDMNDTEKQRYYQQLQEVIANKEKELMEPVFQKIEAAIKKVADKKGLAVVVEKNTVVYGGLDITDEVAKTLQSGK